MTKKVVCGPLSTTIQKPDILPNSAALDFYKILFPVDIYEIEKFINSNIACAITNITIEPLEGGQSNDYTISGAVPEITST